MMRDRRMQCRCFAIALALLLTGAVAAQAQTTAFTYQGKLTQSGNAANGTYDFQFALFDSAAGGSQIGSTQSISGVQVTNGAFTVQLDFGANAFPGASRFLEMSVRPSGNGSYTTLAPRQQISSTPYAIRAANAATADNASQLGGVSSASFVQYNPNGNVGIGANNPSNKLEVGGNLKLNGTGNGIIFPDGSTLTSAAVGSGSGGGWSRDANGIHLTTTTDNVGIGTPPSAFKLDVAGAFRVFNNTTSSDMNVETNGGTNSWAQVRMKTLAQRWLIGTSQNYNGNEFYLHDDTFNQDRMKIQPNGGAISFPFGNVGIGTTTPTAKLSVQGTGDPLLYINHTGASGNPALWFVQDGTLKSFLYWEQSGGYFGIGVPTVNPVLKIYDGGSTVINGSLTLYSPHNLFLSGVSGTTQNTTALCVTTSTSHMVALCSSSLRYKTNVQTFMGGLDIIKRLRPITFNWKSGGPRDVGFGAEEVEQVSPLFTFRNDRGEVEGVKYNQLSTVFVNAFKEQQAEIEKQQRQIEAQEREIQELKRLIYKRPRRARVRR